MSRFCRCFLAALRHIYNCVSRLQVYANKYSGKNVTMLEKVRQYFVFLKNCFAAPDAGVAVSDSGRISWQLHTVSHWDIIGIVIFALAILSFLLHRKQFA